jgi:hypothetical protein
VPRESFWMLFDERINEVKTFRMSFEEWTNVEHDWVPLFHSAVSQLSDRFNRGETGNSVVINCDKYVSSSRSSPCQNRLTAAQNSLKDQNVDETYHIIQ